MNLVEVSDKFVQKVRVWNKEVFGNILHQKNRIRSRLEGIQRVLADRPSSALIKLEMKLKDLTCGMISCGRRRCYGCKSREFLG